MLKKKAFYICAALLFVGIFINCQDMNNLEIELFSIEKFKKNMVNLYGQPGEDWLNKLPSLVKKLEKKWNLHKIEAIENLSFNYLVKCTFKNIPAVLKIGFDKEEIEKEAQAIEYFNEGCVKLLQKDLENKTIIIEQVLPGDNLATLYSNDTFDTEATEICCEIIKKLQSINLDKNSKLIFSEPRENFETYKGSKIPREFIEKAILLKKEVEKKSSKKTIIHGDVHHYNILKSKDGWVSIDPKGFYTYPETEPVMFILNPLDKILSHKNPTELIKNRIKIFSEQLGLDADLIKKWAFIVTVKGSIWSEENNLSLPALELAKIIDKL